MARKLRQAVSIAFAVCALGGATPFCHAVTQEWKIRHVHATGGSFIPRNVEAMVSDIGGVRMGYALNGPAYLSTLNGNMWVRDPLPTNTFYSSFVMDDFGQVTWAGYQGTVWVGVDLGSAGGFVDAIHPSIFNSPGTLTLDPQGLPGMISWDGASRVLSQFDPQSGQWQDHTIAATSLPQGFTSLHTLAYTPDGRAVAGYFQNPGSSDYHVVIEHPTLGWRDVAAGAVGLTSFASSVAVSPTGEIGFAFVNDSSELAVGIFDGTSTTFETITSVTAVLAPRSLAVDPTTGQFVLAYSEGTFFSPGSDMPLHLARRTGAGSWSDEILPIDAIHASVTFDDLGDLFLGVSGSDYATLVSNSDLVSSLLGDANKDGVVDAADFTAVELYLGDLGPTDGTLLGDADHNGRVDGNDWIIVEQQFGSVIHNPEPLSVILLSVGSFVLIFRRSQSS